MLIRRTLLVAAAAAVLGATPALAQDKSIVVASTTSTQDSGLFGHILPLFKAKTGIEVKVLSLGTGQALDTGRRASSRAASSSASHWRARSPRSRGCCFSTSRPQAWIPLPPRRSRT